MACITKLSDRKGYVIDFYDNQGKRRKMTLPAGTTKAKARERLREIEEQLSRGNYIPGKKIPTFKQVAKSWLRYKKPNLRASTWSVYEGHTRNHFKELNPLKINRITTATIEQFITDRQNQGMHILTLRKILVTLGQIMGYAVRHKYLDHNPARDAERPRGQGESKEAKIRILNPAQIKGFLDAVESPKYRTLFMLAIMTGARQGELLGLKWGDMDWDNRQIHIQRTFNNQMWFDTKSKTSNRRVDIGPAMVAALKWWRAVCPESGLGLVFPNEAGEPINHNNMVNRHFNPALKRAGLPLMRFHDLRHTYASLLIEQGDNVKYIQKQLGHSTPTVTLNVYAHLMKPVNQESPEKLEMALFGKSGNNMGTNNKKGATAFAVTP